MGNLIIDDWTNGYIATGNVTTFGDTGASFTVSTNWPTYTMTVSDWSTGVDWSSGVDTIGWFHFGQPAPQIPPPSPPPEVDTRPMRGIRLRG